MKASLPVLNEEGPQRAILLGDGRMVCLLRRAMRGPAWTRDADQHRPAAPVTARIEWLDGDVRRGPRGDARRRRTSRCGRAREVTLEPGEVRVYASAERGKTEEA